MPQRPRHVRTPCPTGWGRVVRRGRRARGEDGAAALSRSVGEQVFQLPHAFSYARFHRRGAVERLVAEERKEIAKKAAEARWSKKV